MKQELDEYLCKVFPKIFAERNLPMQETAMCWGFDCGDGWFNIINQLCQNIQHHIDWKNKEKEVVAQVVVSQVKEKYGTLRFYMTVESKEMSSLIREAEEKSSTTCEVCGEQGEIRNDCGWKGGRWFKTMCDKHYLELKAERQ